MTYHRTYSRATNRLTAELMAGAITRTDGRTNEDKYLLPEINFPVRNARRGAADLPGLTGSLRFAAALVGTDPSDIHSRFAAPRTPPPVPLGQLVGDTRRSGPAAEARSASERTLDA